MKSKRCLAFVLLALLLVASSISLAGCGESSSSDLDSTTSVTSDSTSNIATRTVTDRRGRTVEIPSQIERIAPLGDAPRYLTYLGLADKFVGIQHECEITENPVRPYGYPYRKEWAKLPNIGTDASGAGIWYEEELIACDPDIIVTSYQADICDDIQQKTGIPVIGITNGTAKSLFTEEYNDTMKALGEICGVPERANELVSYIENAIEDAKKRTKDVPDDQKLRVLASAATFSGTHSIDGIFPNFMTFELLSAKDVTKGMDGTGGVLVDKEKILDWNPDMIFFDADGVPLVVADYQKNPDYFKSLKAVQEGKLYQWPSAQNHGSNVEISLCTLYYVGKLLYPEQFSDIDFEKKASEIFNLFIGDPDYLKIIEDAGKGYMQVKLEK